MIQKSIKFKKLKLGIILKFMQANLYYYGMIHGMKKMVMLIKWVHSTKVKKICNYVGLNNLYISYYRMTQKKVSYVKLKSEIHKTKTINFFFMKFMHAISGQEIIVKNGKMKFLLLLGATLLEIRREKQKKIHQNQKFSQCKMQL